MHLESINKILFEELKDKTSGTNLVVQMLNNKNQKGLTQYIKNLLLILDENCLEMESLFENLIIFMSKNQMQKKLYHTYYNLFDEIDVAQFKICKELLITFNKDEENIINLGKSIVENHKIFKTHNHTFYILVDAIFSRKFKIETHQVFSSLILNSNLNTMLSRNFIFLLIDHFYEQPYRDFKKDFPHITLNSDNINRYLELLNDTKFSYYNANKTFLDFEDKTFAIEKTKDYLLFLIKKSHIKKELTYEHQRL